MKSTHLWVVPSLGPFCTDLLRTESTAVQGLESNLVRGERFYSIHRGGFCPVRLWIGRRAHDESLPLGMLPTRRGRKWEGRGASRLSRESPGVSVLRFHGCWNSRRGGHPLRRASRDETPVGSCWILLDPAAPLRSVSLSVWFATVLFFKYEIHRMPFFPRIHRSLSFSQEVN